MSDTLTAMKIHSSRYHKSPGATEEQLKGERTACDRNSESGNQELMKKRHDVATSYRGRDRIKPSTVDKEVATSAAKEGRSRHHLAVVT